MFEKGTSYLVWNFHFYGTFIFPEKWYKDEKFGNEAAQGEKRVKQGIYN